MKRFGLLSIYEWGLLAVMFGVVIHAPLSVAGGVLLPDFELGIKAWKEFLLGGLTIVALVIVTRRHLWEKVANDSILRLCAGFVLLHLLLAAILGGSLVAIVAGLLIDLRFVGMFMLMYILILLRPQAIHRLMIAVAAGAAVVLGFGLLQVTVLPDDALTSIGYSKQTITPYTTIDSNPEYVRVNSTLRGPNPLGALAVVYGALALAYLVRRYAGLSVRRRVGGAVVAFVSVAVLFASYSRSAYLAALVAAGTVLMYGMTYSRKVLTGIAVCVVIAVVGLGTVASTDWFSNVILHEDPESSTSKKSNDEHIVSLGEGTQRLMRQPLGAGIGSTGSASLYDEASGNDVIIENYYLFVAHESGWLGLAWFLTLFGYVMTRLWQARSQWPALGLFASGVGLGLIGMLLPVWADETVSLIWWGFAGATIASVSGIMGRNHAK